jgi:hypothetical protein
MIEEDTQTPKISGLSAAINLDAFKKASKMAGGIVNEMMSKALDGARDS